MGRTVVVVVVSLVGVSDIVAAGEGGQPCSLYLVPRSLALGPSRHLLSYCYARPCCCNHYFRLCAICICVGCCWYASNTLQNTSNLTNASPSKGHEMTATIAQMYLHPSVLPRICSIVYPNGEPNDSPCHLGVLATWADRIRGIPQYRWAGAYHYVGGIGDWPPSKCQFGEQGWQGRDGVNVLGGIYNTTNWLREGRHGASEAIKFLIHFVGDLHQPLHLTSRDRGGNGGKPTCFTLG